MNPFRLLRLSTRATEEESVWQARRILTQLRAGLELAEPDLLPWLPPGDELDVQEAAQKLEEPLRRLIEQLSWFDLSQAPQADVLQRALTTQDAAALKEYLEIPAPRDDPGAAVALLINKANLSLVLGFSMLHLGAQAPVIETAARGRSSPPGKKGSSGLAWQEAHGLQVIEDAHRLLPSRAQGARHELAWRELLADGFKEWVELLKEPRFHDYVQDQLRHIAEDLAAGEHQESVERAIKTLLADLIAGELKLMVASGQFEAVSGLVTVATKSGLDPQLLGLSLRSLRHLFQAELSELENLIAEPGADLQNVALYLRRLGTLLDRWRLIDSAGMLQLAEVGDEGVARAFHTLRQIFEPGIDPTDYGQALAVAYGLASSRALKERIRGYQEQVKGYREQMLCYFCERRERTPDTDVVLTGKIVTGVERHYNGTTTHYKLVPRLVPRCETCADFHGVLKGCRIASWIAAGVLPITAFLLSGNWFIGVVASCAVGLALGAGISWYLEYLARAWVPKGSSHVTEAAAYQELLGQGFSVVRINYARGAAATWQQTAGDDTSGLWALGALLVFILWMFFRAAACSR